MYIQPVIFELERQREPLLIVGHQAVLRCLYAYFLDLPAEEIPFLSIPLHTLLKLEVNAYGCREKRVRIVTRNDKNEDNNSSSINSTNNQNLKSPRRIDSMAKFQS
jgi:broad specificity phosphatase PhoE